MSLLAGAVQGQAGSWGASELRLQPGCLHLEPKQAVRFRTGALSPLALRAED